MAPPPDRPPAVAPGGRIRVVAPAGRVDPASLAAGLAEIPEGYEVSFGAHVRDVRGYLAGEDEARLLDLQEALDDPQAAAVVAARGGSGTTRILDRLRLEGLAARPKWIVGSSDLTALLVRLWSEMGLASIHGPMVAFLGAVPRFDRDALFDLLEGVRWRAPGGLRALSAGRARGPLVGGNLTVLAHLAGAVPAGYAEGSILFLEDVNERPYRVDRCLVQLLRAGVLERAEGFVLGGFSGCEPGPDGTTVDEVLAEHLEPLGVPVVAGYPAAHGGRNHPFVHGGEVEISSSGNAADIEPT